MKDSVRYFVIFILVLAAGFLMWYFRSILFYILISAIISLIARPISHLFRRINIRGHHVSNGIAALLTMLVIWTFVLVFFGFAIPLISSELNYFSTVDISQVIERANRLMYEALDPLRHSNAAIVTAIETQIKEMATAMLNINQLKDTFTGVVGFFGGLFVAIFSITFITFFFLKEEGLLLRALMLIVPEEHEEGLQHVLNSTKYLLRRYFIGILIQIFLICLLITTGFLILGFNFNHALTVGLITGLLNVIPYVGPLIGTFFGLLTGLIIYFQTAIPMTLPIFLLSIAVVYIIVQLIDNIIFQPIIFSSSVHAHPLEIFIVIMASAHLAGVLGMFLAIPVYTIIRVIAKEFFYKYKLVKKLTWSLKR